MFKLTVESGKSESESSLSSGTSQMLAYSSSSVMQSQYLLGFYVRGTGLVSFSASHPLEQKAPLHMLRHTPLSHMVPALQGVKPLHFNYSPSH